MYKDILVIIPAYNEDKVIANIIRDLKKASFQNILVINDGSTDKTTEKAKKAGANVLEHLVNIGVGGVMYTGFEYIKTTNFKYLLSVDADGQHCIEDVKKVANELIKDKYDHIIGSRLTDLKKKRPSRYIINQLGNLFILFLSGKKVTDSQSGLRGYTRESINSLKLETPGYEVISEITEKILKNKQKIKEVEIKAIYTEYSQTKDKYQKIGNIFDMVSRLLLKS